MTRCTTAFGADPRWTSSTCWCRWRQRLSTGFARLHRTPRMLRLRRSGRAPWLSVPRAVADTVRQLTELRDVRSGRGRCPTGGDAQLSQLAEETRTGPVRRSAKFRSVLAEVLDGIRSTAEGDLRVQAWHPAPVGRAEAQRRHAVRPHAHPDAPAHDVGDRERALHHAGTHTHTHWPGALALALAPWPGLDGGIEVEYAEEGPRGAEPRWWEDVAEGDVVGPMVVARPTDIVCWHVGMGMGLYGVAPLRLGAAQLCLVPGSTRRSPSAVDLMPSTTSARTERNVAKPGCPVRS